MGILYLFDCGSAQAEVRAEIKEQLASFEEGYQQRDNSILYSYMEQLFSRENILIPGTMPEEI